MLKKMSKEKFIYLSAPQVRNHANMEYDKDIANNKRLVRENKDLLRSVADLRKCANDNWRKDLHGKDRFPDPENFDKHFHEIVMNNDASQKTENNISIAKMNDNLRKQADSLQGQIPGLIFLAVPK